MCGECCHAGCHREVEFELTGTWECNYHMGLDFEGDDMHPIRPLSKEPALPKLTKEEKRLIAMGYKQGAKETKERILIAIKMAGGMAEQFGNPIKADTLAHIYVLIEAMPVDGQGPAGIE